MGEITIPTRPARAYQRPAWAYLERGGKHCLNCWHRRAGKDEFAMSWTSVAAMTGTPGNYWHMLPEYKQARKALWDGVDPHTGRKRIDQIFPPQIVTRRRDDEMMLEFVNGSTWQLLGSDRFDQLVGAGPKGLVMSELSLSHPNAWAYLRPMLLESGGWFIGNFTPRGRNHAHAMFESASAEPDRWFADKLTAYDTGVFTAAQLEEERAFYHQTMGVDDGDAKFRQEYLCDFNAAIIGTYYAREMEEMGRTGRICDVPYDPGLPVFTSWDLGIGDATCIIFCQLAGGQIRIIDFAAAKNVGVDAYVKLIREKPYVYERHFLPHDADHSDFGIIGGKKRVEVMRGLGMQGIEVLEREAVDDGIQAVRRIMPRMMIDKTRCKFLIDALNAYRRTWDAERRIFHSVPYHDWASDPADTLRYLAMGLPEKFTYAVPGITKTQDRYRDKASRGGRKAAPRSRWAF